MEAAREGHEEMVGLLLNHGANINAQTEETQETALTLACCGGFLEVNLIFVLLYYAFIRFVSTNNVFVCIGGRFLDKNWR